MSGPISFNAYTGWVDITDPLNIPADARIISAADLLRYESFGTTAAAKINEVADVAATNTTALASTNTTVAGHTTTISSQAASITANATAISAANTTVAGHTTTLGTNATAIAALQTDVTALKALTGAAVKTSKGFDLTVAGGAKNVGSVLGGSNYTSFEVEVTVIGRTASGPLYSKVARYVRPENGTPVYLTLGTDIVAGGIAVTFTTNGATGVNILATASGVDAFVTVHVEAKAGAGASSVANRTVTVAMA